MQSQAAYVALTALCVTDGAVIQPRPQPKPALMDYTRTLVIYIVAIRSSSLLF